MFLVEFKSRFIPKKIFVMHYDHMNIMISKDLTLSLCFFFSVYVISYFDVFFLFFVIMIVYC